MEQPLWKVVTGPQMVKNRVTIWPSNFTPRSRKMKTYVHTKTCTWMFITALFTAEMWKPPTCPSTNEYINKIWLYPYYKILFNHKMSMGLQRVRHDWKVNKGSTHTHLLLGGFPGGTVVKNLPANAGDMGSIPESERSLGGRNSNPLQYSCLENSMDGGAWWCTVHRVAKSQIRLSN